MDLHRSRSCATLIQSLYDIFCLFLDVIRPHYSRSPRPLLPFILPSISNRCTPSGKFENVIQEMQNMNLDILGIAETHWTKKGR